MSICHTLFFFVSDLTLTSSCLVFPFSFGSPLFSCHLIYLPPLPHLCYSSGKESVYAEQKKVSGLEQANGEILKAITEFPGNLL